MESCSLHSSTLVTVSTRFSKSGIIEKTAVFGQVLKFPSFTGYQLGRKLKIVQVKAQASARTRDLQSWDWNDSVITGLEQNGMENSLKVILYSTRNMCQALYHIPAHISSGTPKFSLQSGGAILEGRDVKDENLAFVAGATGRAGSRTVRELLKLGFRVRAAVRSSQKAESLVQSVKQMKLDTKVNQAIARLEIVECDLEKPKQIGPALGNASVVLCCIGASEKEIFDITGPYRIDYLATKNLIDAATVAKVSHFFMVSSLGTNKVGFPAALLNLFWGVLIWKRKAEEALIASGVPYTIVRPGGMERPTDAYKETHNLFLSEEDTLFGGQVSNLQVAELMAFMAKNRRLSYCKVIEVIAETTAPLTPMDKLLENILSQRALPKELDTVDQPGPATMTELAVSDDVVPKTPSSNVEEAIKTGTKPLSPYTAYEDLKPPTTPSPSPRKST